MTITDYCEEVLPHDVVDRNEWLRVRRAGLGGSDCSAVMGMNRLASPYTVWEDKTGRAPERPETEAMRWGVLLEPAIRAEAAARLNLTFTLPGTLRSRLRPWQQYNPDGLASDGGLIECKNTSAWMSTDWNGQVPDHAELQVQHGMSVTGATHAWVAGLIGGNRLEVMRVDRDDELIEIINTEEDWFWRQCVLTDTPPPMDPSEATRDALQRRFPLEDRPVELDSDSQHRALELAAIWANAQSLEKRYGAEKKQAENDFRLLMAGANRATVAGETVARITGGTWAAKRFEEAHPDVADQYRTKVEVLDSTAVRADRPELWKQFQAQVFKAFPLIEKDA